MANKRFERDASGNKTVYPHVVLRSAARWALQVAEDIEKGSFYQALLACLATAFTVEAYLNFLGEQLFSKWNSEHEKKKPKDKLKIISQKIGFDLPFKSTEYQAFTDVFALRNALVHGKVESVSGSWQSDKDTKSAVIGLKVHWEKFGTPKAAKKIHNDCIKLVHALHAASGVSGPAFGALMHGIAVTDLSKHK